MKFKTKQKSEFAHTSGQIRNGLDFQIREFQAVCIKEVKTNYFFLDLTINVNFFLETAA